MAQRDITLSSSQVFRLVTERPERLSLKILMALLDILDCSMDDLIEPIAVAGAGGGRRRRRAEAMRPAWPGCDRNAPGSPGEPVTKRIDRSLLAQQVGPLLVLLAELEPALETETVVAAVREAAALPTGQRRIAQEVVDRPDLLTGQAAAATLPGVLRFIDALVRAGATTVVAPLCPRCGRQRPLGRPFNGLRLCAGCTRKAVAMPCGRCGKLRPPARRNDNGQPVCQPCWWSDSRSWKTCTAAATSVASPR